MRSKPCVPLACRSGHTEQISQDREYAKYPLVCNWNRLVPLRIFPLTWYFRAIAQFPVPETAMMSANIPDSVQRNQP